MIPSESIQQWAHRAPWPVSRQIEQDLIISRALCDIFNSASLAGKLAFRGGTAINKLLFDVPTRYSEDIDLVQLEKEPIGKVLDGIRDALSWLGKANVSAAAHSVHMIFKFEPEDASQKSLKLKVEVNTREHTNLMGTKDYPFSIENKWYTSSANIISFHPDELFATKLRALLQRRKNRDLFDLGEGLSRLNLDASKVLEGFNHYLSLEGQAINRAEAEKRMLLKLQKSLIEDISPLLPSSENYSEDKAIEAFGKIWYTLVVNLPGPAWKLTEENVQALRAQRFPGLLKKN